MRLLAAQPKEYHRSVETAHGCCVVYEGCFKHVSVSPVVRKLRQEDCYMHVVAL